MPTDTATHQWSFKNYARSWLIFLAIWLVLRLLGSWLFDFEFGFLDILVCVFAATLGMAAAWGSDVWKQRRSGPQPPREG